MGNEIFATICSTVFILIVTLVILYVYHHFFYQKLNDTELDERSVVLFIHAFLSQVMNEKFVNSIRFRNQNEIDETSEEDYIQSYRIDENDNSKIYYRSSKNYGEDEYYNVRTWFGVNDEKLNKEEYDYICFNIKGVEKIYFKIEDFTKLIETYITLDEQKKYSKRKSYDTYIQRSKNDNNYYIKRLGSHLKKPILVK